MKNNLCTKKLDNVFLFRILLTAVTFFLIVVAPVTTMADKIPGKREIEVASAFFHRVSDALEGQDYTCIFSSTDKIFHDLASGSIRLAIATEPNEKQYSMLKESEAKVAAVKIFDTPLVVFVNRNVETDELSLDELKGIYTDDTSGTYNGFTTYQLTDENGSQHCFKSILEDVEPTIGDRHKVSENMNAIIEDVGNDNNGIGYAFWEFYKDYSDPELTKLVTINGKSYSDAGYEIMFPVYLFIRY